MSWISVPTSLRSIMMLPGVENICLLVIDSSAIMRIKQMKNKIGLQTTTIIEGLLSEAQLGNPVGKDSAMFNVLQRL